MIDILLVDDEQIYRETLTKTLTRGGFRVGEADGSHSAVRT